MEDNIFLGLTFNEIISSIVLPFLFFYILYYVFLRKGKIFGKEYTLYYSLSSILLSIISTLSIFLLGLSNYLPLVFVGFIIVFFFVNYFIYLYENLEKKLKIERYDLNSLANEILGLVNSYNETKENKEKIKESIKEKVSIAEELAKKKKIDLEKEEWYIKAKKIIY